LKREESIKDVWGRAPSRVRVEDWGRKAPGKQVEAPEMNGIAYIHSFIHSFKFNSTLKAHAAEYNGKTH